MDYSRAGVGQDAIRRGADFMPGWAASHGFPNKTLRCNFMFNRAHKLFRRYFLIAVCSLPLLGLTACDRAFYVFKDGKPMASIHLPKTFRTT